MQRFFNEGFAFRNPIYPLKRTIVLLIALLVALSGYLMLNKRIDVPVNGQEVTTAHPNPDKTRCHTCSPPGNQFIYMPLAELPEAEGGELVFNSRSGQAMDVTPIFYKRNGETVIADPVRIESGEIRYVDLKSLLPNGNRRERNWGGFALTYYGSNREMWAQFRFLGVNGGQSLDEFFTVKDESRSSVYEATWWRPKNSEVTIALGNISDTSTSARLTFGNNDVQAITLRPHATELVKFARTDGGAESLRIEVTGSAGSVVPSGFITSKDQSFNTAIRFYDPSTSRQAHLFANGFRVAGTNPHMVLKNTTSSPIAVVPRFIPASGVSDQLVLPQVQLQANSAIEVDLTPLLQQARATHAFDVVSVDVTNDAEPGSIIGALYALDQNGDGSYETPLRDSGTPRTMTGVYPWKLADDYRTVAYITNISSDTTAFVAELRYAGGKLIFGPRQLEPGETAVFDLQKMRDERTADRFGNSLPAGATLGQFRWAVFGLTNGKITLIGRAEMVSRNQNVTTSYSCQTDCGPEYAGSIDPNPVTFVGKGSVTTAYWTAYFYDNSTIGPFPGGATWSLDNPSLATLEVPYAGEYYNVLITGAAGGSTTLFADLGQAERYSWDGLNCVDLGGYTISGSIFLQVNTVTVNEVGFSGDHLIKKFPDGTSIDGTDGQTPTWKRTSNPNDPVAYTKGANITMFAKLGASASAPSTSATLRVKNGSTVIATKTFTLSGTNVTVTGISTSSALETTVKATTPTFTWEISYDSGSHWWPLGDSGPHTMYWTYDTPLSPSFQGDDGFTYSALYDLALQKATAYANGSSNLGTIISNLNTGVDGDSRYNPAASIATLHPLFGFSSFSEGAGGIQCSDEAQLLRGLLRSIGIDGTVNYIWAGPSSTQLLRYTIGSTGLTFPSFRLTRSSHDDAPLNPHFKFHAVVATNSTWYDPSYGLTYSSLSFNETANNNTAQQVRTSYWSSDPLSSFSCSHTGIGGNP